jgi:RNA polymerase sigma-70 factor (ECF subfamily)
MNEGELAALYEAEYAYVERTLRRLGVATADLADVAHDLFVVVHRRHGERDATRPLRAWLFGIALKLAANYRKRAHRTRELPATATTETRARDGAPAVDEQVADAEERARLLAALDTLEFDQRAVIVLHDLEGTAAPEVAATLGVPVNTVYSRLRVARQNLIARVRGDKGEAQ